SPTTGATADERRHADRQRNPPPALRARRDDPGSAGAGLRRDPADDHRAGGGAVRAVAGAGVPDRARVRGRGGGSIPVGSGMRQLPLLAAIAAAILSAGAVAGFGAALDGYSQALHPVGLLGARGLPHALAFNVLGFVRPGVLAAFVGWRLRAAMDHGAPWAARIGAWLALLSALAFVAQGLLPL